MSAPAELLYLCDWLEYKPGWFFSVMDRDEDRTLVISILTIDSYHPDEDKRPIMHYTPLPETEPPSWKRWLLDQIVKIETHEACEFFQVKGFRPFAPSHEPGEAPYIITERC